MNNALVFSSFNRDPEEDIAIVEERAQYGTPSQFSEFK